MKRFITLLTGIIIGGLAVWYYLNYVQVSRARRAGMTDAERLKQDARSARDSLNLRADEIKAELERTGQVIRRKATAAGHAIADATADARTTAAIKAKLVADRELSAWDISVSTTDGRVTLSGNVSSPDQIGKAISLAMETDGAHEVLSTLRVKPKT